jgi:hypothetical protein
VASAAQDVVDRDDIRSPVHGIVVKNNFHTTGGVVAPGGVILKLQDFYRGDAV